MPASKVFADRSWRFSISLTPNIIALEVRITEQLCSKDVKKSKKCIIAIGNDRTLRTTRQPKSSIKLTFLSTLRTLSCLPISHSRRLYIM